MFKAITQWRKSRRKPLSHDVPSGFRQRAEETGVGHRDERVEFLRDPDTGYYWVVKHHEQTMGTSEEFIRLDKVIGEAILQYPEMFTQYLNTGELVIPHTDSIEHPACLSTKVTGSVGSELLSRLESVAIADHANRTQVLKDPLNNQYWLVVGKSDGVNNWSILTSLDERTSQRIVKYPSMVFKYTETGEWVSAYTIIDEMPVSLVGLISAGPNLEDVANVLVSNGLDVYKPTDGYLRIEDFKYFCFSSSARNRDPVGTPVRGGASTVVEMSENAELVSTILTKAGMKHKFEIRIKSNESIHAEHVSAYLHHRWPDDPE